MVLVLVLVLALVVLLVVVQPLVLPHVLLPLLLAVPPPPLLLLTLAPLGGEKANPLRGAQVESGSQKEKGRGGAGPCDAAGT